MSEKIGLNRYWSMVDIIVEHNIELMDFLETLEHETDSEKLKSALGSIYKRTLSVHNELSLYWGA